MLRGLSGWVLSARHLRSSAAAIAVSVGLAALLTRPGLDSGRDAVTLVPVDDAQRQAALDLADDLWSDSPLATPLTIVVDAEGRRALQDAGIEYEVVVDDIDAVAAAERRRLEEVEEGDHNSEGEIQRPTDWFAEYKRAEAVDGYLDTLVAARPELARVEQVGQSLEGRPIRAIRISTAPDDAPAFVIDGGLHAREWIGVMTTTCIADRLVRRAATDEDVAALLSSMAVWVVPLVNPDGYAYSWDHDRYWRKNRREGHGVDLNRNWPVAFGGKGSSKQPASPVYHGEAPLSEPESRALKRLLDREPVALHIDFHSFSQLLLYPWSHTAEPSRDRAKLAAIADHMASAIYATHGERYEVIEGARLYPAAGTLMDWVYGARRALSYVVELRPRRGDGFVLPPEQIVPTCDESLAATLELAKRARG